MCTRQMCLFIAAMPLLLHYGPNIYVWLYKLLYLSIFYIHLFVFIYVLKDKYVIYEMHSTVVSGDLYSQLCVQRRGAYTFL